MEDGVNCVWNTAVRTAVCSICISRTISQVVAARLHRPHRQNRRTDRFYWTALAIQNAGSDGRRRRQCTAARRFILRLRL